MSRLTHKFHILKPRQIMVAFLKLDPSIERIENSNYQCSVFFLKNFKLLNGSENLRGRGKF